MYFSKPVDESLLRHRVRLDEVGHVKLRRVVELQRFNEATYQQTRALRLCTQRLLPSRCALREGITQALDGRLLMRGTQSGFDATDF